MTTLIWGSLYKFLKIIEHKRTFWEFVSLLCNLGDSKCVGQHSIFGESWGNLKTYMRLMKEVRLFSKVQIEHRSQVCRFAGSLPVASLCCSNLLPKLCEPLAGHEGTQCQEVFAEEHSKERPLSSLPED